jgi:DNA polymerase III subunit epsilon
MTWHLGGMCAFDTESTGIDVEADRIVTATVVSIDKAEVDSRSWLISPGITIPESATAIHGVTDAAARASGDNPAVACVEIARQLYQAWEAARPVIGYNIVFDFSILDRELRRHHGFGLDIRGPVIDPFVIDKAMDPYRKGKRTLTATCEHYNVALGGAHDATEDALAAGRLAWRLAQVYPRELGDLTMVNSLQAAWRAEWSVSFADYLRRQGTPEEVDGSWPLRPYREPAISL